MKTTKLFQSVELSQDVPNTNFHQGDLGIVVEYLEPNETLTFPVKSKIQQCKLLEPLSGKTLRHHGLYNLHSAGS